MASFQTRENGNVTATVRRTGYKTQCETFPTAHDAKAWARDVESRMDKGQLFSHRENRKTTVGDLLERYWHEIAAKKKSANVMRYRIEFLQAQDFAALTLDKDVAGAIRKFRDARMAGDIERPTRTGRRKNYTRTPAACTVGTELSILRMVFRAAIKEWDFRITNPMDFVKAPENAVSHERDVTWTDDHVATFLAHLEFDETRAPRADHPLDFLPWCMLIARHTGMRLGEICSIRTRRIPVQGLKGNQLLDRNALCYPWVDHANRCVVFDKRFTKQTLTYHCPLSAEALKWIDKLMAHRGDATRLIEPSNKRMASTYYKARKVLAHEHPEFRGLNFHDLRHTWTTEVVGKIDNPLKVQAMSGRKTLKSLKRYYNPKALGLATDLDSALGYAKELDKAVSEATAAVTPTADTATLAQLLAQQQELNKTLLAMLSGQQGAAANAPMPQVKVA